MEENFKSIFLESLSERDESQELYHQMIKDFQKLSKETPSTAQLSQLNMDLISTLRDKAQMVDSTIYLATILQEVDRECEEIKEEILKAKKESLTIEKKIKEREYEKEQLMTELKRRDEEIKSLYETHQTVQENNKFLKESNEQLDKDVTL
jgi:chromosome segregation ATPase